MCVCVIGSDTAVIGQNDYSSINNSPKDMKSSPSQCDGDVPRHHGRRWSTITVQKARYRMPLSSDEFTLSLHCHHRRERDGATEKDDVCLPIGAAVIVSVGDRDDIGPTDPFVLPHGKRNCDDGKENGNSKHIYNASREGEEGGRWNGDRCRYVSVVVSVCDCQQQKRINDNEDGIDGCVSAPLWALLRGYDCKHVHNDQHAGGRGRLLLRMATQDGGGGFCIKNAKRVCFWRQLLTLSANEGDNDVSFSAGKRLLPDPSLLTPSLLSTLFCHRLVASSSSSPAYLSCGSTLMHTSVFDVDESTRCLTFVQLKVMKEEEDDGHGDSPPHSTEYRVWRITNKTEVRRNSLL